MYNTCINACFNGVLYFVIFFFCVFTSYLLYLTYKLLDMKRKTFITITLLVLFLSTLASCGSSRCRGKGVNKYSYESYRAEGKIMYSDLCYLVIADRTTNKLVKICNTGVKLKGDQVVYYTKQRNRRGILLQNDFQGVDVFESK